MKLSIIVPVYNVEEYIEECIISLCNQTLKEIEIIIVNDGTKDNSINKIKKIKDNRIKIINQKNKGLSGARNTGIKVAKGEYIAFVDSDDFIIIDNAYEEMYTIAVNEKSDIVSGNALWYYSNERNYPMNKDSEYFLDRSMSGEEFFLKCMKSKRIYAPVWINIYKRELLIKNNIFFKEGIFHEDEEFTPRILLKAKKISIYNKEFYGYRQRENSIMNSGLNIKRANDIIDTCLSLEELCYDIENIELRSLFRTYLLELLINQIKIYKLTDLSDEVKKFALRNSTKTNQKIRTILIINNLNIFLVIQKIYKSIKKYTRGKKYE